MWKNLGYWFFSWCMKRPYIFMQLSSTKGFGGLSLLMECEGWIGKLFSVRWAWGKMRSAFLHHLAFNLAYMYVFTCWRKQSHLLHPGFSTLTIKPWIGLNIIALELYFDVVSTDEEEAVPSKLKKSAKQTENVTSKGVQQVEERYLPSFSFIIFHILAPNHGVHLEHKILLWKIIWLLLKISS